METFSLNIPNAGYLTIWSKKIKRTDNLKVYNDDKFDFIFGIYGIYTDINNIKTAFHKCERCKKINTNFCFYDGGPVLGKSFSWLIDFTDVIPNNIPSNIFFKDFNNDKIYGTSKRSPYIYFKIPDSNVSVKNKFIDILDDYKSKNISYEIYGYFYKHIRFYEKDRESMSISDVSEDEEYIQNYINKYKNKSKLKYIKYFKIEAFGNNDEINKYNINAKRLLDHKLILGTYKLDTGSDDDSEYEPDKNMFTDSDNDDIKINN